MTEKKNIPIIKGFSRLSKEDKIKLVSGLFSDPRSFEQELKSFWHPEKQELLDEFSENTIGNYPMPYGVVPNVLINDKMYMVPMVIEESSVVAAASNSARFWASHGGFRTRVLSTTKTGQVHFTWEGETAKLQKAFPELKKLLLSGTEDITRNMVKRGGGIREIQLVDMTASLANYYQLKVEFETADSMGANFINSCLEEMAAILRDFVAGSGFFSHEEQNLQVIMSILSNYTPECLVECKVETAIENMGELDSNMDGESFTRKFEKAVQIARIDPFRAATHNKGIFNGIDAVALATANDFRAIEAGGHTWASRSGKYTSLTDIRTSGGRFEYSLTLPLAMGTVGGLTSLHPMARHSLEMLGKPGASELMMITAAIGLANNFGAIRSLITRGIQAGHMKMHLQNILNQLNASEKEKKLAGEHFRNRTVSHHAVAAFLESLRKTEQP